MGNPSLILRRIRFPSCLAPVANFVLLGGRPWRRASNFPSLCCTDVTVQERDYFSLGIFVGQKFHNPLMQLAQPPPDVSEIERSERDDDRGDFGREQVAGVWSATECERLGRQLDSERSSTPSWYSVAHASRSSAPRFHPPMAVPRKVPAYGRGRGDIFARSRTRARPRRCR
jgi:hypothetical protein